MMSNKEEFNDSIDTWLNENLENYAPEVPQQAWQAIASRLKKRRNKQILFWYSISTVSIILGFFLFYVKHSFLANKVSTVNIKEQSYSDLKYQNESNVFNINTSSQFKKLSSNKKESDVLTGSIKKISKKYEPKFNSNKVENFSNSTILTTELTRAKIDVKSESYPCLNEFSQLPLIVYGSSKIFKEQNPNLEVSTLYSNSEKSKMSNHNPKNLIWVGARINGFVISSNRNLSASYGQVFISNPGLQGGLQSGLQLQLDILKNWKLGFGLEFQEYIFTYNHMAILKLLDGIALNPGDPGLKNYAFKYEYTTISGINSIDIKMSEQDHPSSMKLDEPFMLNMVTNQIVDSWILPISLQRNFGSKRTSFVLNTGVNINFTGRIRNIIVHYTEACQDLCFSSSHTPVINSTPIKKINFTVTLGAGINYKLKKNILINLIPEITLGSNGIRLMGIQSGIFFNIK